MAILPMLRLSLVGHKDEEEDVLALLQDLGVLEVEKINLEADSSIEWLPAKISDINRELSRLKLNITFLRDYIKTNSSIIDLFVPQKLPFSEEERKRIIREFEENDGYSTIESWQSSLEEIKNSVNSLSQDKELLTPFEDLNFPIRDLKAFKYVDVLTSESAFLSASSNS